MHTTPPLEKDRGASPPPGAGRDASLGGPRPGLAQSLRSHRGIAVLVLVSCALVFLVALGASRSSGRLSSHRLIDPSSILGDLTVVVVALLVIGMCMCAYILFRNFGKLSVEDEMVARAAKPAPWWAQLLSLFVLLAALGGGIAAFIFRGSSPPQTEVAPVGPPGDLYPPDWNLTSGGTGLTVHWWILGPLAGVALLAAGVVLWQWRRRQTAGPETESPAPRDLGAALQASLDELEEESDPRRAVIQAYASMERALSEHGICRKPSETHVEYLARWAGVVRVTKSTAQRLAGLYEQARFSTHLVDEQMKVEARGALLSLRSELEHGASPS